MVWPGSVSSNTGYQDLSGFPLGLVVQLIFCLEGRREDSAGFSVFCKLSLNFLVLVDSPVLSCAWFPAVHSPLQRIKPQMSTGVGVDRVAIRVAGARRGLGALKSP